MNLQMVKQLELFGVCQALSENTLVLANYIGELNKNVERVLIRGALQRFFKLRAQGWDKEAAADEALKTGKGLVGEALATAEFNMQARILQAPVRAQINPISNDPTHDIQFIDNTGGVQGGVQMKIGTTKYVRQAVRSGKYTQVVANKEAVEELEELHARGLLKDRLEAHGIKGEQLKKEEIIGIGKKALHSLEMSDGEADILLKSLGKEATYLTHNVFQSALHSFCLNVTIEFTSKNWENMDWEKITKATLKMVKHSTLHYGICRLAQTALKNIALNCPGSIVGKAARFILRRGAWITAGVSMLLTIWDDYRAYKNNKIERVDLYQNVGGAVGSGVGGVLGGVLGARLLSSFGPTGVLIGALIGTLLFANLGGFAGRRGGEFLHNIIHPESFSPYLLLEKNPT